VAKAPRKVVENEVVYLDYGDFRETDFRNCKLIYKGGRPPNLINNNFHACEWIFEGDAGNTVAFLRALAAPGAGGRVFLMEHLLGIET